MEASSSWPRVLLKVLGARNVGVYAAAGEGQAPVPTASNIYCRVQCGEDGFKTNVIDQTIAPVWDQQVTFGVALPLGESIALELFASVEGGDDKSLGTTSIIVGSLPPDEKQQLTLPVVLPDGSGGAVGELILDVLLQTTDSAPASAASPESATVSEAPPTPVLVPVSGGGLEPLSSSGADEVSEPPPVLSSEPSVSTIVVPTQLPPNFIAVTVLEAVDLKPKDQSRGEASSDPVVKLNCTDNSSQKTSVQEKTLHPTWRQTFYFALSQKQTLELIVEDDDMFSNDKQGRCVIDIDQWRAKVGDDKQVIWLALDDPNSSGEMESSDISSQRKLALGHGKICIALEMRHIDRKLDDLEQGELDHATAIPPSSNTRILVAGAIDTTSTECIEENVEGDVSGIEQSQANENEPAAEETAEEIKKREEEHEKKMSELANVQLNSGDYQIRVRIIEVRDLKPMDLNGTCDPVVSVECMGQQQHTVVKKNQLSCVFDEYLNFNFRKLDHETAQQGSITITVRDADAPAAFARSSKLAAFCSDTIGSFSVDIPYVYYQKDHELNRKWVALAGCGIDNADSIQGYLLLSIIVLGPGDRLRIHKAEEERDTNNADVTSKKDISALVIVPPRIVQKQSYLVVTIFQAQDLPDMDQAIIKKGGIDGYVRVYFAGQAMQNTKTVSEKGSAWKRSGSLSVEFNQELWFPVMLPTMSNNIFISIWDYDLAADQLVGKVNPYLFSQVQAYPDRFKAHWANLYGPPIGYVTESKAREHMFDHPRTAASSYRGRILLSMRIEDGSKSVNDLPHIQNLISAVPSTRSMLYTLRAALSYGTEIPKFQSKTSLTRNSRMGIKISIGNYEVLTTRVDNIDGICHWNEYVDIPDVKLPADIYQVPDVFVHLVRERMGETRCVCFARFRAADVFFSSESVDKLREIPTPTWVSLIEDSVVNDLEDHDFTGNVLMSLRLAPTQSESFAKELSQRWREHAAKSLTYTKYTILAHVFQARCLPAADSNGLLDPYIKITCSGVKAKLNRRNRTRDPCFYETVKLDVDLPQDRTFRPKLSVQVFDFDKWNSHDYIGAAQFSTAEFDDTPSSEYAKRKVDGTYSPPCPKWYPIHYLTPGDTEGELLLSFEVIRKETPGTVVEPPESIRPPSEEKFVEIIALGCRGLQPLGFMPVNSPWAKFEVGEISKTNRGRSTNPSSKPSSQNPNFLERIVIPVRMPVDALYAPRLMIQVLDQHLGGFYESIIGVASVDLGSKLRLSNGVSNPEYSGEGEAVYSGNPYVEKKPDFSTFPGAVPPSLTQPASRGVVDGSVEETKQDGDGAAIPSSLANAASLMSDFTGDEEDSTPHYLRGREVLDDSLEDTLQRSPFETYSLFRGDMIVRTNLLTGNKAEPSYHPVGCFKGMIRILDRRDEPPLFDLNQFLKPEPYLVRVYVLDALQLQPKDENNKCDPYLRISVGDGRKRQHLINDRDNHKLETVSPKFHKMYEFKATLPGASELRVEVLDYDFFAIPSIPTGISNGLKNVGGVLGGDDFIGATLIDLEDRWFSTKWQELGGDVPSHEKRKPIETRPLYAPFSTLEQGRVRMWVDILTPSEMKIAKPWDVSLPPVKPFEVRVIVYRARGVTPGDFTDLTDLYVKTWLQSRDDLAQTTDTHWRARDGKASFNWRMKFPLELPIDSDNEADKGYLHLQLWDKDLLYNDCLAETFVDLTSFLKIAYKTHQPVDVFGKKRQQRVPTSSGPMLLPGMSSQSYHGPGGNVTASASNVATRVEDSAATDQLLVASQMAPPPSSRKLLKPQEQKKEKAESLVQSLKQRFGMGGEPDDASWLTFRSRDPVTGESVTCGELLVSVEILPRAIAQARAAGLGRSEPNNFPFLAEPADRLHLSAMWNPLYVLEAFIGPKYYRAFMSAVICGCFVALIMFAGPIVNFFLTLLQVTPKPYGLIIFLTLFVLLVLSVGYFTYRCRSAFQSSTQATGQSNQSGQQPMPVAQASTRAGPPSVPGQHNGYGRLLE